MSKVLSRFSLKVSESREKNPLLKKIFPGFKRIKARPLKEKLSADRDTIYDKISRWAIYILIFLLPILFLPWTANALDFNKQALLIALVFIALFAWMLKVLISGRIILKMTKLHIAVGVLLLVSFGSTIFSLWRYGSFWGWPLNVSESLISLICLVLLYFLVVNVFEKKKIPCLINILIASSFFVFFYGILQLFGKFVLSWDFTKVLSFNTVGSVNKLGLFTAVLLPLIITSLITAKKRISRLAFAVVLALAVISLILINFSMVWWVIIIVAALIMASGMQRSDFFDNRWLVLPMFLLAISLFFTFFNFRVPGIPERPVEVYLTNRASFNIALETLKERPIFGSGPGTFAYDFSKHKKETLNQSSFWNIRFDQANSKIINVIATNGVLGIISILAIMGLFIFYGVKFLFKKTDSSSEAAGTRRTSEGSIWMTGAGIFIAFIALIVGYFLYSSNLTLDFIFFLLLGSFISLIPAEKREFILKPSSLFTLAVTFVFTIVFIFGLGFFILEGQRYSAEISYLKGIRAAQAENIAGAINKLEGAARLSPKMDIYWRELSQIYLRNIAIEARRTDLPRDQINQKVQLLINNAVNSAKRATDINPKSVANWSVRGFVYNDLTGVVGEIEDWAVKSYDEALNLEPVNPYYPTQKGISLLRGISFIPEENSQERANRINEAKIQFERAIELKSDYAPARFQLALIYQAQGKPEEAIEELKKTKSLAPFDVGLAFQLGLIYFQIQDYNNAQAEFERAIAIDTDYANALYFLGLTYEQQGKIDLAIEKFEKVAESNPNNLEIKTILKNLKTGREPLTGIVEEVPPVAPIDEIAPEGLEQEE